MANYFIKSNEFYILSGPSASGKSSFTRQLISQGLPDDAIVSSDTIRKQILGTIESLDDYGVRESLVGWELNQPDIFKIIDDILTIRFKQNLPTVLDATNLNDTERAPYVKLAQKYGISSNIIIFDTVKEELELRLSRRTERFDFSVVEKQLEKFQKDSQWHFHLVTSDDTFILLPNLLPTLKIDVVGDTHGLFNETLNLLAKKGWSIQNEILIHEDKERKVLFLGDIIDRGDDSIALLKTVCSTTQHGQGLFILGNHEAKLINSYEQYLNEGILRGRSLSSAQTLMNFLSLEALEQKRLYEFLKTSSVQYSLWVDKISGAAINEQNYLDTTINHSQYFKIAFAHADNDYYKPYSFPRSHALYGQKKAGGIKDTDAKYQKHYDAHINEYIYVRGHIPALSQEHSIYSLEDNQAFEGHLVMLDLEKYIQSTRNNSWNAKYKFFEENIVKEKSEFNFDKKMKTTVDLLQGLTELVKEGLATDGWRKNDAGEKQAHPDGFKIYKYSKKVHFKKLWKKYPLLSKARGIGLDIAGNLVVHPFDKLYNYGEYDTGNNVKPEQKVQVVEKLNGFLGCISRHPFKSELLLSTTGSFNSPFIQYIADFIDDKTKNKLLEYFKHHNETLMFEVIHPEDKHIIDYDVKNHGLWLIGARERELNAQIATENRLDKIGHELGFKRPFWYEASFQDVLNALPSSQLEGFMIRDAQTHEPLMKIKTDYYLVTKFIGRMGPNNTEFMFKNPEKFKENNMDEEFYPIVDKIVKSVNQQDFNNMEQKTRVEFVRKIVDDVRLQVSNPKIKP